MSRRLGGLLAFLLLGAMLSACDATDQALVVEIGTTQLIMVDSGVAPQGLMLADQRLQSSDWDVGLADASYPGVPNPPLELTFGEPCRMVDTSETLVLEGACSSGVIIDSSDDTVPLTLVLEFTMEVRRARPVVVGPGADTDGDGIPDDGDFSGSAFDNACTGGNTVGCDDNCPLIPNPDQTDSFGSGIGNPCANVSGVFVNPDNDGDSVNDAGDNCIWTFNPAQTNTEGLAADGIPDGIGDACEEQVATVEDAVTAETTIQFSQTINLLQPFRQASFLTVDLNSDQSLTCDWDAGTCKIDTTLILLCVRTDLGAINLGC